MVRLLEISRGLTHRVVMSPQLKLKLGLEHDDAGTKTVAFFGGSFFSVWFKRVLVTL